MSEPIAIISAKRTPIGGLLGSLVSIPAPKLGAIAINAAREAAGLNVNQVDEIIMGCVLSAGIGQAPARQAALHAGLDKATSCTTVNKVCGSGMSAVMMACNALYSGQSKTIIAGGMENMSRAPHLLPLARQGYRYGDQQVLDHMHIDGLQDPFQRVAMGQYAEQCADKYGFTRETQDAFALVSLQRAQSAIKAHKFQSEIEPVTIETSMGTQIVDQDQQPFNAKPEKIPKLRPAFKENGTVTAANASSISDGAAALALMLPSQAEAQGIKPIALIHGYQQVAHEPEWFTTAPVAAIKKTLKQVGWTQSDVDLWEINEAFAVVALAAMQDLGISHNQLNIHGGACALGHPIGASGARIIVSLIHALKHTHAKKGIASLCIGGGEATAVALELV